MWDGLTGVVGFYPAKFAPSLRVAGKEAVSLTGLCLPPLVGGRQLPAVLDDHGHNGAVSPCPDQGHHKSGELPLMEKVWYISMTHIQLFSVDAVNVGGVVPASAAQGWIGR